MHQGASHQAGPCICEIHPSTRKWRQLSNRFVLVFAHICICTYYCIRISTTVIPLDNKVKAVEQSICRSTTQLKHHHHCLHWHPSSILRSLQKKAEAAIVYVHEETKHKDISFWIIDYSCFGNTVHWPMHHLVCWTIVVAFQLDALCK